MMRSKTSRTTAPTKLTRMVPARPRNGTPRCRLRKISPPRNEPTTPTTMSPMTPKPPPTTAEASQPAISPITIQSSKVSSDMRMKVGPDEPGATRVERFGERGLLRSAGGRNGRRGADGQGHGPILLGDGFRLPKGVALPWHSLFAQRLGQQQPGHPVGVALLDGHLGHREIDGHPEIEVADRELAPRRPAGGR